jgi:hypothetical protein
MNPLDARKQLLIVESELNRTQLVQEWQAITDDVAAFANRARQSGADHRFCCVSGRASGCRPCLLLLQKTLRCG